MLEEANILVWLVPAFLLTALLYSMAGFGGGSTYNALLVLGGVDYRLLPSVALCCNIVVVANGTREFSAAGQLRLARVAPLVLVSAPAAWLGGRLAVPEELFIGLLGASLLVAGLLMFADPREAEAKPGVRAGGAALAAGGGIGFLSGLVGIGGGIFLAPILHFMRWSGAKEIAGAASFFILVNSLAGLAGQTAKLAEAGLVGELAAFWPLPAAALAGGVIGSFMSARRLPPKIIKRVTGVLILIVAARLLWRLAAG